MNYKLFDEFREMLSTELELQFNNQEICEILLFETRKNLMDCVMDNYEGIQDFKIEYETINDTMLIDDTEMLLKIFIELKPEIYKELKNLLSKFKEIKRLSNCLIIKSNIHNNKKNDKRELKA